MNIHFDLVHPSDVNLFKNAIVRLHNEGQNIFITLRERGRLSVIAKKELGSFEIITIGKHKQGFLQKLFALINREINLFRVLKKNQIQISVNQGFSGVISCKILKIPFLNFEDDFEYKLAFHYARIFSKRDIMPDFIPAKGRNIFKYQGFKELAYLHPKEFVPDLKELDLMGLIPFKFVFIREIANISLNYNGRESFIHEIIDYVSYKKLPIVLSLEDKSLSPHFKNRCIILEEPVIDLYSIIANSLFAISSGDSMAREASLLGTPTIYSGGRNMMVNRPLLGKEIMFKADTIEEAKRKIDFLLVEGNALRIRGNAEKIISKEWDDTTDVIIKHIKDFYN